LSPDIDTIYRDNWVSVRAELDSIDPPWCDQPWNMTLYPDPLQDPCMCALGSGHPFLLHACASDVPSTREALN
jgi:hypothetical protein